MKKVVTYHFCDVCGRREVFESDRPLDWEFINYSKTWKDGAHAGNTDCKFLACEACLKEDSRKLFTKLLGIFKGAK
jgi:hypothetical protein